MYQWTLAVPPQIPALSAIERRTVVSPAYAYEMTIVLLGNYSRLKRKQGKLAEAEALARKAVDASRQGQEFLAAERSRTLLARQALDPSLQGPGMDQLQPNYQMWPHLVLAEALAAQDRMEETEEVLDG